LTLEDSFRVYPEVNKRSDVLLQGTLTKWV